MFCHLLLLDSKLTLSSRQIRPPIYSLKQSKLRKRRVVRYAILYFFLLVVFLALIVGPIIVGSKFKFKLPMTLPLEILQPTGYNNNDTTTSTTGQCINGACPVWNAGADETGSTASETTAAARRFRRYMAN